MSQPKMKVDSYGTKRWYLHGRLHREGGPAIEWSDGSKWWCLNGQYHREGGPAIEYPNGSKCWYLHGERHREDGPAIEESSGTKFWYLHGKEFSFEDYIMELERMGLKERVVDCIFQIG